nr:multidrug resistance-associated protein 5 [Tanacetum cinerariifolium]
AKKDAEEEARFKRRKGILSDEQIRKEKSNDVGKGKEKVVVESDSVSENDGMIKESDSDDSDYSIKSFDYLSAGEEELIQLKLGKPIELGEKFLDVAELKDCLSCYALSNGYSIWYERSSADQVIIVYGQRPPTLKEPSLGKQRKQISLGKCEKQTLTNYVRGYQSGCAFV